VTPVATVRVPPFGIASRALSSKVQNRLLDLSLVSFTSPPTPTGRAVMTISLLMLRFEELQRFLHEGVDLDGFRGGLGLASEGRSWRVSEEPSGRRPR